ncbi:MAG TPA: tetratricopeptide repeat protein, partial [Burkholderiaceae bacterium]|nr:tetratricopeptide repeat protein [Burkholderiaceae bacterium]
MKASPGPFHNDPAIRAGFTLEARIRMRTKLFDCSSLSFFAGRTRIASCVAGALLVLSSAAAHGQTINVARGSHAAKQTTADTRGRITSAILAEVMLAEIAAQRGDLGPAFRAFMAVAEQTSDARLARRAAEVAVMARDDESALTAVRLWVRLAPLDKEADAALGALLVETGRFAEVEPKLAARLKESPAPGAAIEDLQRSYARARDRNAAFASLARLAAPYTDDASTHLALARMAFLAGLNDRAVSEAREAARRDPTSEIAALTVAQLLAANAPDEAVRALETHVKNNPNAINVRIALARVYGSKGRIDDARRELLAVIERRPENLDALLALGVLEYQARNLSVAETRLKAYLAQAERVGDEARDMQTAYITLSQIAEDRRQFDEAIDWMTRLQPPSIAAQTRIAQLHAKAGRVDQGLNVVRAIQPGD